MNLEIFLFQVLLCMSGVGYILYVGYKLHIEKKQIQKPYQLFFIENKRYLSPNMISLYRAVGGIPCAFIVGFGLYFNEPISLTFVAFVIAVLAIGDFLDGMVAHCCDLITEEGKKLDALADKFFDIPILISLTWDKPILLTIVFGIMIADIIGTILRSGMSNPAATKIGKYKTTFKFFSMFILYTGDIFGYIQTFKIIFIIVLLIALILAITSTLMKVISSKTKTA